MFDYNSGDRNQRWGDRAVLVAGSDIVFGVTWFSADNGAIAFAVDPEAGKYIWAKPVSGVGEVFHSRWRNEIGATVIDDHLIVVGFDGSERYVEIFDRNGERESTQIL